jgi:hypothetical protein
MNVPNEITLCSVAFSEQVTMSERVFSVDLPGW